MTKNELKIIKELSMAINPWHYTNYFRQVVNSQNINENINQVTDANKSGITINDKYRAEQTLKFPLLDYTKL